MADVVLDTNILVDFSRGLSRAHDYLLGLAERRLAVSAMTRFELIAGCRDKQELRKIERLLQRFEVLKFGDPTTDLATRLLTRFSLSHGLSVPDACIAAATMIGDVHLSTGNTADFKFIRGLRLISYP